MSEEDSGRLPRDKCLQYAIVLFPASAAALATGAWQFQQGSQIVSAILLAFGAAFFVSALWLSCLAYVRLPSRAAAREERRRYRQLEQARERERSKWESALEIIVKQHKDDRVSFDPIFFRTGPVGYGLMG